MSNGAPPPHVTAAAAVVNSWLQGREQPAGKWTDEQFKAATPAQRIDYARQFPQEQFQKQNGVQR